MKQPEKQPGVLERLPKLGRISQLILLIGIFAVILAGLLVLNNRMSKDNTSLSTSLADLRNLISIDTTPKASYEAQLAKANANAEAVTALFPTPDQAPEITAKFMELASINDINITETKISTSQPKDAIGPVLSVELGLSGQVPKFENFLLAVDNEMRTTKVNSLSFSVGTTSEEYDTAVVKFDVYCYTRSK